MKYMRALALGVALAAGTTTFAAAQAYGYRDNDHDRDRDRFEDRQAYRAGYDIGKNDAIYNRRTRLDFRRWRDDDDRRAFQLGYDRGYQDAFSQRRVYIDRGAAQARDFGYQDGLLDGQHDRQTGHSFRPTHDGNYRHADRGYSPLFGNKDEYKLAYRQAYESGYDRGYNGERFYRR